MKQGRRRSQILDLANQRFGKLVVESFAGKNRWGAALWLCRCDCGKTKVIVSGHLRGGVRSCGCLAQEVRRSGKYCHGKSQARVYRIWDQMKSRCSNAKRKDFYRYGGRGIKVCERWSKFENFYDDMGEPPTSEHTLDRINNENGYEPGNCRWATRSEQGRNKSNNVIVVVRGEKMTLIEAVQRFSSLSYGTISRRIYYGWDVEKAIFSPRVK